MSRARRVLTDLLRHSCSTQKFDEKAPEIADLYFAYGKALLENAIAQSGVLGKQDPEDGLEDSSGASRYLPVWPSVALG